MSKTRADRTRFHVERAKSFVPPAYERIIRPLDRAADILTRIAKEEPGLSSRGALFIEGWEGFRSCPYQDSVKVWTIGIGTTSGTGRNIGPSTPCISRDTARLWLQEDIKRRYLPSVPKKERMRQQEIDALASFVYNLGPGVVSDDRNYTIARRLKSDEALTYRARKRIYREELPKFVYAGRTRLQGLVKRRDAEVKLAVYTDYSGRP